MKIKNKNLRLSAKTAAVFIVSFFVFLILFNNAGRAAQDNKEKIYQKQKELESVQKKINIIDASIKEKKAEMAAAEREAFLLDRNIEKVSLEIQQTGIAIEQMDFEIESAQNNILEKEILIEHKKAFIKNYLRAVYELDNDSFIEILFSEDEFSRVWADMEFFKNAQEKMRAIVEELKEEKTELEENKNILLDKREEQNNLFIMQDAQKSALDYDRIRKEKFIKKAESKKNQLENDLESANKIKNNLKEEIFNLKSAGVSMTMQKALEYANFAAAKTGIRPEFLLGLLKVESDLGNNVGTGYYKTDMNPAQHEAFFAIAKKLGVDPETAPVSKRPSTYKGWGGAMGPAQMMPKTWLGYEADIADLTGHNLPSPWNNQDAFTAAALKLSRDGAFSKNKNDEWKAAMMYLAGSNWNNPKLAWYGDRVLKLAEVYGS